MADERLPGSWIVTEEGLVPNLDDAVMAAQYDGGPDE